MRTFLLTVVLTACAALLQSATASMPVHRSYSDYGYHAPAQDQRMTWTIRANGASEIRLERIDSRAAARQQLLMMEHFQDLESALLDEDEDEAGDEESDEEAEETAEAAGPNDEELEQSLRVLFGKTTGQSDLGGETKLEALDVTAEEVRTVISHSHATLEEAIPAASILFSQHRMAFETTRFETTPDGRLQVTLTPGKTADRYAKQMVQTWKAASSKVELKFVLPGKVLAGGLPDTSANSTWISIDGGKPETLDAAEKLFQTPLVITAETGGLDLPQPIESSSTRRRSTADLPINDAGPGFVAEASSVTTSTVFYFPEGEKHLQKGSRHRFGQPGVSVRTKLFVPRGRTILSTSNTRVVEAFDDKGRPIETAPEAGAPAADAAFQEDGSEWDADFYGGGSRPSSSASINLSLPLPAPDAESIEELSAESVVVTAGNWKELTLEKIEGNAEKEIDLSTVLEGAKLVINQVTFRQNRITIQAKLTGPESIRQIEFQGKLPGRDELNLYASDRSFTTVGSRAIRHLSIQSYIGGADRGGVPALSLVIRLPDDVRRERVRFTLTGLDLF